MSNRKRNKTHRNFMMRFAPKTKIKIGTNNIQNNTYIEQTYSLVENVIIPLVQLLEIELHRVTNHIRVDPTISIKNNYFEIKLQFTLMIESTHILQILLITNLQSYSLATIFLPKLEDSFDYNVLRDKLYGNSFIKKFAKTRINNKMVIDLIRQINQLLVTSY